MKEKKDEKKTTDNFLDRRHIFGTSQFQNYAYSQHRKIFLFILVRHGVLEPNLMPALNNFQTQFLLMQCFQPLFLTTDEKPHYPDENHALASATFSAQF